MDELKEYYNSNLRLFLLDNETSTCFFEMKWRKRNWCGMDERNRRISNREEELTKRSEVNPARWVLKLSELKKINEWNGEWNELIWWKERMGRWRPAQWVNQSSILNQFTALSELMELIDLLMSGAAQLNSPNPLQRENKKVCFSLGCWGVWVGVD